MTSFDLVAAPHGEAMAEQQVILEALGLTKEFKGFVAVKNVNLRVQRHTIHALIGPNGAGKSSLVLAVGGVLRPREGHVLLDGRDLTRLPPEHIRRAGVAVVPEGRRLLPDLTVADNLRVATYALDREQAASGVDYAVELFPELKTRWRIQGRFLSGGEQQMVVLAQAIVSRPSVLLVDELSLGLAPVIVDRIYEVVREINAQGTTIVLVEQNANYALDVSSRGYVLETGHVVLTDTSQNLRNDERVQAAYLGT